MLAHAIFADINKSENFSSEIWHNNLVHHKLCAILGISANVGTVDSVGFEKSVG